MFKKLVGSLSRRPWDILLCNILLLVGIYDTFAPDPFPPELDPVAPIIIFHVYGVYLVAGTLCVLSAIFFREKEWSRRIERMGMMLIAGATLTLAAMTLAWLLGSHQIDADGDDLRGIAVGWYSFATLIVIAAGSLLRWHFLGTVKPVSVRQDEFE